MAKTPCQSLKKDGSPCQGQGLSQFDSCCIAHGPVAEARRHGIAPVPRGHPAYQYMRDGDSDGIVCE